MSHNGFTDEEIGLYRDESIGPAVIKSPVCRCVVWKSGKKAGAKICSHDCIRAVAENWLPRLRDRVAKRERSYPKPSYRETLDMYYRFAGGRLSFGHRIGSAYQGKASREWHVKQWRESVEDGLLFPFELIGEFGMTEEDVLRILRGCDRRILGLLYRKPSPEVAEQYDKIMAELRWYRTGKL